MNTIDVVNRRVSESLVKLDREGHLHLFDPEVEKLDIRANLLANNTESWMQWSILVVPYDDGEPACDVDDNDRFTTRDRNVVEQQLRSFHRCVQQIDSL